MEFIPIKTKIFKKGEDLFAFFCRYREKNKIFLEENSVCIVSSKVVALAQGRQVEIQNEENFFELIEQESEKIFSPKGSLLGATKNFLLTKAQGIVIPNAGIDRSNTKKNTAILWPKNPQKFAENFREQLKKKFSLKNIAVVISDSRITPLRRGTVGVAMAWAGLQGVYDIRGEKDIFGNILQVSTVHIADNIVSGAEILMGQGDEKTPFVVCKNFPQKFFTTQKQHPSDAFIDEDEDLFCL